MNDFPGYIYVLQDVSVTGFYKIGRARDLKKRINFFEVKLPFEVQLILAFYSLGCVAEQRRLHQKFAMQRQRGEWFKLSHDELEYLMSLKNDIDAEEFHTGYQNTQRQKTSYIFANLAQEREKALLEELEKHKEQLRNLSLIQYQLGIAQYQLEAEKENCIKLEAVIESLRDEIRQLYQGARDAYQSGFKAGVDVMKDSKS